MAPWVNRRLMDKLTVAKDDVEAFCNTCVLLRSLWRHYEIWLEGSELLQSIAPIFFGDIHALFVRDLILEICKITDPAETMGRTNLTVKFLIKYSDFSSAPNTLDKLKRFSDSMHAFRDKIVPARNRLIAHFDRESVHLGQSLGGASPEDWLQFWHDLQDFLHIMHKHYVDPNSHFYLNGIAQSDAEMVVKALKESAYFRNGTL
jgi:AbiU2